MDLLHLSLSLRFTFVSEVGVCSRVVTVEETPSQEKLQHLGWAQCPPPNTKVYGRNHQPGLFPHILPIIKKLYCL